MPGDLRWMHRIRRRWRRLRDRPMYWRWRRTVMSVTARRLLLAGRLPDRDHDLLVDVPAYPKLFIIGPARSGTTWVSDLLGQHPDVVTEGESHAYNDIFGHLTRQGNTPGAWTEILTFDDQARRRGSNLYVQRYVDRRTFYRLVRTVMALGLTGPDAGDWLIDRVFDRFYRSNGGDGRKLFVEKTPNHTLYAGHILDHHTDARVVEVLRDGRDVAVSKHMKRVAQGRAGRRWTPEQRDSRFEHWARYARVGMELQADPRYARRIHLVRYESVQADPAGEVSKLFAFAGLDHDDALVERIVDATTFGARGPTGEGQHRRKGVVGDWKNYFTDDDQEAFAKIAGDVLEARGYLTSR